MATAIETSLSPHETLWQIIICGLEKPPVNKSVLLLRAKTGILSSFDWSAVSMEPLMWVVWGVGVFSASLHTLHFHPLKWHSQQAVLFLFTLGVTLNSFPPLLCMWRV